MHNGTGAGTGLGAGAVAGAAIMAGDHRINQVVMLTMPITPSMRF